MKTGRQDSIRRAIKLVRLFQSGRALTVRDVMDELNISKHGAYRWLREASLQLPVYEAGFKLNEKNGRRATAYKLLNGFNEAAPASDKVVGEELIKAADGLTAVLKGYKKRIREILSTDD